MHRFSWESLEWNLPFLYWPCKILVSKFCWLYKTSLPHKTHFFSLEEFVQDYCYFIKCLGDFNSDNSGLRNFLVERFLNYILKFLNRLFSISIYCHVSLVRYCSRNFPFKFISINTIIYTYFFNKYKNTTFWFLLIFYIMHLSSTSVIFAFMFIILVYFPLLSFCLICS